MQCDGVELPVNVVTSCWMIKLLLGSTAIDEVPPAAHSVTELPLIVTASMYVLYVDMSMIKVDAYDAH